MFKEFIFIWMIKNMKENLLIMVEKHLNGVMEEKEEFKKEKKKVQIKFFGQIEEYILDFGKIINNMV